eukprot:g74751.t1
MSFTNAEKDGAARVESPERRYNTHRPELGFCAFIRLFPANCKTDWSSGAQGLSPHPHKRSSFSKPFVGYRPT